MMAVINHNARGNWWKVQIRGDEQWKKFFSGMEQRLGSQSQIMQRHARMITDEVAKQGTSGLDVNGRPGAPLKPNYQTLKARKGGRPIRDMKFTGSMYRSLRYDVKTGAGGTAIVIYFGDRLNQVKASVHYYGAPSGRRGGRFSQAEFKHFGISRGWNNRVLLELQKDLRDYVLGFRR